MSYSKYDTNMNFNSPVVNNGIFLRNVDEKIDDNDDINFRKLPTPTTFTLNIPLDDSLDSFSMPSPAASPSSICSITNIRKKKFRPNIRHPTPSHFTFNNIGNTENQSITLNNKKTSKQQTTSILFHSKTIIYNAIIFGLSVWILTLTHKLTQMTNDIQYLHEKMGNISYNYHDLLSHRNALKDSFDSKKDLNYKLSSQNDEIILDINVDTIRLQRSHNFVIHQIGNEIDKFEWDIKALIVYVGDTVIWNWKSNDNIISCDSLGNLHPNRTIYSGSLGNRHLSTLPHQNKNQATLTYNFTFTKSGTYYYKSENSPFLKGMIIVHDIQILSLFRKDYTGPLQLIPKGLQTNLKLFDIYKMDGCWEICQNNGETTRIGDTLSQDHLEYEQSNIIHTDILAKCVGDWIFVGALSLLKENDLSFEYNFNNNPINSFTNAVKDSNIVMGGFGRKENLLNIQSKSIIAENGDTIIRPVQENNISWYSVNNVLYKKFGYASLGLSSQCSDIRLSKGLELTNNCMNSISLTYDKSQMNAFSWSVNCIANPTSYSHVIMTNTCPIYYPPKN